MTIGPIAFENWKAAIDGKSVLSGGEAPAFTDTPLIGEIREKLGPYQILNTIVRAGGAPRAPAIVFRYSSHINHEVPDLSKTSVERYHGGGLADELAALTSVAMGIRLHAGGENRIFGSFVDDPRGHPYCFSDMYTRDLPPISSRPMLPRCADVRNLNSDCEVISTFPFLSTEAANALIRAARMYQEAVWISETSPSSAWLLLVSAVEVAANQWRAMDEEPIERLESSRPTLLKLLRERGDESWVNEIAVQLAPYLGATKKFTDFLLTFLPDPPTSRNLAAHEHSWGTKELRDSFRTIYGWRSRALHGGVPFPAPMCEAPLRREASFSERPFGSATATLGGVWAAGDAPMLLHLFEYIVRGAILSWWRSMTI